jgi:hypothetical protein
MDQYLEKKLLEFKEQLIEEGYENLKNLKSLKDFNFLKNHKKLIPAIELAMNFEDIQDYYHSDHLYDNIEDVDVFTLAQNITWLRHSVPSYDKCWGRGGYGWNKLSSFTHDEEKEKANKVAIKKILKLGREKLNKIGITKETFEKLQNWKDYLLYSDCEKLFEKVYK